MLVTSPSAAIPAHEHARFPLTDGGHELFCDEHRTFGPLMDDDSNEVLSSAITLTKPVCDLEFKQPSAVVEGIKGRTQVESCRVVYEHRG